MASLPSGECAVCNKTTSTRCKNCSEGLNIDGIVTPTYYCGKECQTADWKTHKNMCKDANLRKQVFRAGSLLQAIFYELREHSYVLGYDKIVKDDDGNIHLYESPYPEDGVFEPFPTEMISDDKMKKAVLTCHACNEAVLQMEALFRRLLKDKCHIEGCWLKIKPICKLVVYHPITLQEKRTSSLEDESIDKTQYQNHVLLITLENKDEYIVDLTGAQYGQFEAVVPLKKYAQSFVAIFGEVSEFVRMYAQQAIGIDAGWYSERQTAALEMMGKRADAVVQDWEEREGTKLVDVFDQDESTMQKATASLLYKLREDLPGHSKDVQQFVRSRPAAVLGMRTAAKDSEVLRKLANMGISPDDAARINKLNKEIGVAVETCDCDGCAKGKPKETDFERQCRELIEEHMAEGGKALDTSSMTMINRQRSPR